MLVTQSLETRLQPVHKYPDIRLAKQRLPNKHITGDWYRNIFPFGQNLSQPMHKNGHHRHIGEMSTWIGQWNLVL